MVLHHPYVCRIRLHCLLVMSIAAGPLWAQEPTPPSILQTFEPGQKVHAVRHSPSGRMMLRMDPGLNQTRGSTDVWQVRRVGRDYVEFETGSEIVLLPRESILWVKMLKTPQAGDGRGLTLAEMRRRIELPIEVEFRRTPLVEAIAYVSKQIRVPIEIDGDALKMQGYTQNMPQNLNRQKAPASRILATIIARYPKLVLLEQPDNGSLLLSSADVAAKRQLTPAFAASAGSRFGSQISPGAIESHIKSTRNRLTNATNTLGRYNQHRFSIPVDGAWLVALMRTIDTHSSRLPYRDQSGDIERVATLLTTGATEPGKAAMESVRSQVDSLSDLLRGVAPATSALPAAKIAPEKLRSLLMKNNELAIKRLGEGLPRLPEMTAEQRQSLAASAAIPAIVADHLQDQPDIHANDKEYLEHVRNLGRAAVELHQVLQSDDTTTAKSVFERMTKTCSECHVSYR